MANWATPRERGFVVGFGLLSTPLGALLTAPVAVGLLSLTGSWRAMFYILGAAGLIVLVLFMRIFTDRPDTNPRVSPAELREIQAARAEQAAGRRRAGAAVVSFFRSKTLLLNTLGYFSFNYVNFLLLTWTPSTCRTPSATACRRSGTWA
ncbi:MFS transporter [Achromobacter insuavis]